MMKFLLVGIVAFVIVVLPGVFLVSFIHNSADQCIKMAATKSYPEWASKMRADPKNKEIACLFSKTLHTEPYRCLSKKTQGAMIPADITTAFVKFDPYVKNRINSWPKLNLEHNKLCAKYPDSLIGGPLLN